MSGFLLDTCAISEFKKPRPDSGLVAWLTNIDTRLVALSTTTIGELRYGIMLLRERAKRDELERWLTVDVLGAFADRVLPFDADAADRWGRIRAQGRVSGKTVPPIDAMIAAVALQRNLTVVTRNEADFASTGASVLNPWAVR